MKKRRLGPQNGPEISGTEKNVKNIKLPKNCFDPVGQGGWPSISSWINPPPLGSNGIHFIDCPH
jgi:hypothetical protein